MHPKTRVCTLHYVIMTSAVLILSNTSLLVLQLIGVVFVSAGALVEAAIIMVLVVRGDMLRCCLSAAAASAPGQSEEKLCLSSADELSMQRRSYGADAEETVVFDKSAH